MTNFTQRENQEPQIKLNIYYEDYMLKRAIDEQGNEWIGDVYNSFTQWKLYLS